MVGTQLIKDKSGLKIELPTSTIQEVEVDDELVLFIDKDKKMEKEAKFLSESVK